MPSTLMSSSTSGQWMPCPAPISRKLARWGGVASESRQDQARGTLMTRPSARCATISSFVTRTSRIRGSPPAAVVIPRLHDLLMMLSNDLAYPSQFVCCKPMVPREHQRVDQNLQVFRSRSTWTWGGSLQSKLVKKNRYGPGMPLTRGTQGLQFFHLAVIPAFSFQAANDPAAQRRRRAGRCSGRLGGYRLWCSLRYTFGLWFQHDQD